MRNPESPVSSLLRYIPLTLKITLAICIIGFIVWIATDHIQSRTLKRLLEDHFTSEISLRAAEDRMRFDQYIKLYFRSLKLFSTQKRFTDYFKYLEKKNWSNEDTSAVKYYIHPPPWFPDLSIMRTFVPAHFVILTDGKKRVREVYSARQDKLPEFLLNPELFLFQLSQDQSFLTSYKGSPYIIASKSIFGSERQFLGILVQASPINDEFLVLSQGVTIKKTIIALVTTVNTRIIASSHPELLPVGSEIDALRDRFLIIEKAFFDYGNSDLLIKLATFVPIKEVDALTGSILNKQRKQFLFGALIFLLSFMFIMLWITRRIRRLTQRISDFSKKTLGMRLHEVHKGDKLQVLEESFQLLTEKLEKSQDQLMQSEKLSAMGQFSAGLAHELTSPLTGVASLSKKYRKAAKKDSEEYAHMTLIYNACEHMAKIVTDFSSLSRKSGGEFIEVDVIEIIESTLSFVTNQLKLKGIQVNKEYSDNLPKVKGNKTELRQVVLNIITNARDAMPEGGRFDIKVGVPHDKSNIIMEFVDDGCGIKKEDLKMIFDPFFTTKTYGEGVGLGLSVVYGIIENHKGKIKAESSLGNGTKITIILPGINH